jgi:hypothetical protein
LFLNSELPAIGRFEFLERESNAQKQEGGGGGPCVAKRKSPAALRSGEFLCIRRYASFYCSCHAPCLILNTACCKSEHRSTVRGAIANRAWHVGLGLAANQLALAPCSSLCLLGESPQQFLRHLICCCPISSCFCPGAGST